VGEKRRERERVRKILEKLIDPGEIERDPGETAITHRHA